MQLSLPDPPAGWTLLSLDLQAAVAAAGGPGGVSSPYKSLKSIQLCSTMTVRGAFSSDVKFGLQVRTAVCVCVQVNVCGCMWVRMHVGERGASTSFCML